MRNKGNAEYVNRPLNDAEREFAGRKENHDLIYKYMKCKGLDAETFYDELIFDYMTAVKQYVTEKPELQVNFPFRQILFQRLNGRMMHYWREYYAVKRTADREAVRLDYEHEDECGRMEAWWIDRNTDVENQVVGQADFKKRFKEFYDKCITIEDDYCGEKEISEYLKCEMDLLLEGRYTLKQVNRKTEKQFPYGYKVRDLERDIRGFRRIFREVFGC